MQISAAPRRLRASGRHNSVTDTAGPLKPPRQFADLSTIDASQAVAGNAAFKFLAAKGAAFTRVEGQLYWFQQNLVGTANDKTIVEGDINGDKKADVHIESPLAPSC
jgi:serralysin